MSVEQVKAFFDKVYSDEAFAQKLKDAEAAYKGDKSDKDTAIAAVVIPIAAEAGFNFNVDDFKASFESEGEASAEELGAVAGGAPDACKKVYEARDWCGNSRVQMEICGALASVGTNKPLCV